MGSDTGAAAAFSPWLDRGAQLRDDFHGADPFPLVVIDDFLRHDLAVTVTGEFPALDAMPKSRDYMFADKHELSSIQTHGPGSAELYAGLLAPAFARFLHDLTGWDLFVDPEFHGGGFHQGGDGSYLDSHVDFNVHPLHPDWLRTLNILVYLNPDWTDDRGGHLLVKNRPDAEARAILPAFNRAVIMLTDAHTFHGYRKMSLPPGVTRKSIAAYAYQRVDGPVKVRTTDWVPENAGLLKRLAARNYNTLAQVKNRLLGSGTARNRDDR